MNEKVICISITLLISIALLCTTTNALNINHSKTRGFSILGTRMYLVNFFI